MSSKKIAVEIINIGDELLYGSIANTNAQWMSEYLTEAGFRVLRHMVIADEEATIVQAVRESFRRAQVVLMTGGLGPTKDDVTKQALCRLFNTELQLHPEALAHLKEMFTLRGRPLSALNEQQAALPVGAVYLQNDKGTAPGIWMSDAAGRVVVAMPGVPHEMKHLMQEKVVPRLLEAFDIEPLLHFHVKTVGIGESQLAEQIAAWEEALPAHIKLAYLPSFGQVKLRLTATGKEKTRLQKDIKEQVERLLPLIDKYVFGFEQETLEEVVAALLRKTGKTLAVAESCTGGYLAHCFTKIPGSSAYFQGGVVAYSNRAKIELLGVSPETLDTEGAVSEATVLQMATAVRERFHADIGLATSGIAGPGGATPTKPVGTIWVAYADAQGAKAALYRLGSDRLFNIKVTTALLLDWLRKKLGGRVSRFEDFFV